MRIRVLKTALRYAFLALISLALLTGRGVVNRTHIEELAGARLYSLTQWEVENFPDKWLYRARLLLPGSSLDEQAKVDLVLEYSRLGERERELEGAILKAWALSPTGEAANSAPWRPSWRACRTPGSVCGTGWRR